jgi:hypothetical protein
VVEQADRPIGAMVPVWQLKEWRTRRERFFARIDAARRQRPRATSQSIARDVTEAVQKTRENSRRRPA